jgi:rubredoxin
MAWKCPACETAMRHDGVAPTPGRLYRCHVCRLELVLDQATNRMQVPPLTDIADIPDDKRRRFTHSNHRGDGRGNE